MWRWDFSWLSKGNILSQLWHLNWDSFSTCVYQCFLRDPCVLKLLPQISQLTWWWLLIKCAFSSFNDDARVSQQLHLEVLSSLVLWMLICFVLKTPLVGLVSSVVSVVVLLVASGTMLFPEFCLVTSSVLHLVTWALVRYLLRLVMVKVVEVMAYLAD